MLSSAYNIKKAQSNQKQHVKVIPWKLQHKLVIDLNKQILKKIVKKEWIIKRMLKLNENHTRVIFEKRVRELVTYEKYHKGKERNRSHGGN